MVGNFLFLDRNNIQIDGYTEDVLPLEPYVQKWEAFGFHVITVNGHDIEEIADAVDKGEVKHHADLATQKLYKCLQEKDIENYILNSASIKDVDTYLIAQLKGQIHTLDTILNVRDFFFDDLDTEGDKDVSRSGSENQD